MTEAHNEGSSPSWPIKLGGILITLWLMRGLLMAIAMAGSIGFGEYNMWACAVIWPLGCGSLSGIFEKWIRK